MKKPRAATRYSVATAVLIVAFSGVLGSGQPATAGLAFGTAPQALHLLHEHGIDPQYVQLWAGPWLPRDGWFGFEKALNETHKADRTPVIQFYYWGNQLNEHCFQNGCDAPGRLHKDRAGWDQLADDLARRLRDEFQGDPVVVVLETEFNKDMRHSEDLDAALADKAHQFREIYPATIVVLGFGNWGREDWHVFDRAAAAADEIGLQLMRGHPRDDLERIRTGPDDLLEGAREAQRLFDKPIFVSDIALSSYGGPEYVAAQAQAIERLFELEPELKDAGVHAIVYRGLLDTPTADTSDFYGEGERYFGLVTTQNMTAKPAFDALVEGIREPEEPAEPEPTNPLSDWIGRLPFDGVLASEPEDEHPSSGWLFLV